MKSPKGRRKEESQAAAIHAQVRLLLHELFFIGGCYRFGSMGPRPCPSWAVGPHADPKAVRACSVIPNTHGLDGIGKN
jgi:hypothetical protein